MYDIPCVIFAGGRSSRMGEDKSLLPFGDSKTLTQFQVNRFKPYFNEVFISCKSREKFDFEANFIEDFQHYKDSAPFIGLISVLSQIKQEEVFILSVDTPFFEKSDFLLLFETMQKKRADAVVAKTQKGMQPLCAIYKKSCIPILEKLITDKKFKFKNLFDKINIAVVDFENESSFSNLNYKEEYKKALKRVKNG